MHVLREPQLSMQSGLYVAGDSQTYFRAELLMMLFRLLYGSIAR